MQWPDYDKFSQTKLSKKLENEIFLDWKYEHNLHFVDLYAISKKLNYTNLAHGGASNFAIRMQIDQALAFKPDFIIVGATSSGRIEIPYGKFDHTKLIRNYSDIAEINLSNFDNGILINYQRSLEFSTNCKSLENRNVKTAYNHYLAYLYDPDIDDFKNYYIIQSGLRLLELNKIPYIFLPGPLKNFDWSEFRCWPKEYKQPWDYLTEDKILPGNHLPEHVHKILVDILYKITTEWK